MIRALLYLIIGVFLISFLRMVIGVLSKGLGQLFEPTPANPPTAGTRVPTGGELKRDPVCGTYVPVTNSVQATIKGEVVHFCSDACRKKFKTAGV